MASTVEILVAISAQVHDLLKVANLRAAITQLIHKKQCTPRARALAAILQAIANYKDAFSESDIYALDREALGLVVLLTRDVLNERYAKLELRLQAGHVSRT